MACTNCGCDPHNGNKFCPNCGVEVNAAQVVCVKCGVMLNGCAAKAKNRVTAGILALLLGAFGAHEFYLGNMPSAVIRLAVTLVGSVVFGLGATVMLVIGTVEGILFLTKSDTEFQKIYVEGKKAWF